MDESEKRIAAIEKMQGKFEKKVLKAESGLFEMLLEYWTSLRENPNNFRKLWRRFTEESYLPLFKSFSFDIKRVLALNEEYFIATDSVERVKEIVDITNSRVFDRLGLDSAGKIIKDGYMDTIVQDQTAKRQVQQFLHRTKALKNETQLKVSMKELVKGVEDSGGVITKTFQTNVFDTYQEADRLAGNNYAEGLGMEAALYTGGLIKGSRPFCKERNSKVFLRSEIAVMGTPEDKFGGYTNKEKGQFAGKPKDGYDPFTQCGGHGCRHQWSWINKFRAVARDKTLEIVDGKLVRKS